ncbi:MAG TPA: Ig-like domain-containing protein [Gemmatimonadaceae bacterium]|nr:Ig-like domain-containing protein [Gemmatimonadaceae bacterium]
MTRLLSVPLVVIGLAACASDQSLGPPTPTPSDLQIVSGNNQPSFSGYALTDPLVVGVKDENGAPLPGAIVDWLADTGILSSPSSVTDADGHASVTFTPAAGGTKNVTARVHGTQLTTVFTTSVSFIGFPNMVLILHFDGSSWSRSLVSNTPGFVELTGIWGMAANDIVAAGTNCGSFVTFHFNGTSWDAPQVCAGGSLFHLHGLWGNTSSDIFAAYENDIPPGGDNGVLHYDGHLWSTSYRKACTLCFARLNGVWSRSTTDAYAVGDGGNILHFDGTNWNAEASGTTTDLYAVWGSGTSVFAVGNSGTILYNDGTGWHTQSTNVTVPLLAVWGASPTDVFAVGTAGAILHFDGVSWTSEASGTGEVLRAVWGSAGNSVFVVGDNATIEFYNGTKWTVQPSGAPIDLHGVWGSSATNVYAVGVPRAPK